ncbi:MAG TPA: glycosyltransferase family 87 protein [Pirellulales bacterium]
MAFDTAQSVSVRAASAPGVSPRGRLGRALAILALSVFAACEFYRCVFQRDNDFLWHRNFGLTFLNDNIYESFAFHYLPARAMIDAATAWLPYRVDRAIWLLATCAGLAWCVKFWSSLGKEPGYAWGRPAAAALAVTGCYILRDLPECGLQLFLLFLLSMALWGLVQGRVALCGCSLGLAAVYKVTPAIFLPYLLWKRQWRAAGWMVTSSTLFCLLPALHLGWEKDVALHRQWFAFVTHTLTLADPSDNGVEVPVLRNQSLPLMLARLVEEYPVGHPLYVKSDALVRLANWDAARTKLFVRTGLLVLAGVLAWRCRRRVDVVDGGVGLGCEWAAVCVLIAILSPLCWMQHLVLVIPAALLFAQVAAAGEARSWQWGLAVFAAALMLLVHRDLIGMRLCEILSCYQPHTLSAVSLLTLVLSPRQRAEAAAGSFLFVFPRRRAAV